jgi:hypothetical protein
VSLCACLLYIKPSSTHIFSALAEIPKPLLPVANRPLLSYQLDLLEFSGFDGKDIRSAAISYARTYIYALCVYFFLCCSYCNYDLIWCSMFGFATICHTDHVSPILCVCVCVCAFPPPPCLAFALSLYLVNCLTPVQTEAIVVTTVQMEAQMCKYVREYHPGKIRIQVVALEDAVGTADALRKISYLLVVCFVFSFAYHMLSVKVSVQVSFCHSLLCCIALFHSHLSVD